MPILRPGDDLQAAIDATAAGDALELAPGPYRLEAPLAFRRGLRLVGPGAILRRTRTPHACVAMAHPPAGEVLVLEGLTLGWDENDEPRHGVYLFDSDVLVVGGGRVELQGCRLAGSEAEHRRSSDDMYGGAGLRAYGDAEVRAEGCELVHHGGHGVLAGERARVVLANGWVAGNRGLGLLAVGEAVVEARATAFTQNARGGVAAFDAAALALTDATVQGNGRFGVRLAASGEARLDGCTIEANGGPGVAIDAGGVAMSGGAVRGNGGDGIAVGAGCRAALADLVVEGNRGFGVAAGEGAAIAMARVGILGNARGDVERADRAP